MSIIFENVWKIYKYGKGVEYPALRNVSFRVEKGELVAVLGPSGSGKTTLVYIAGGIETPNKGKVIVSGKDIGGLNETERAKWRRRNIGIVFQFYHLVPTLTALENVLLPMELAKQPEKNMRIERALELLEIVGMKDKADKFPSQLSGGEQQRVAIARALAADPPIILADEPTANLDTSNKEIVIELLTKASEELGKTVIYTTHDPRLASKARRILKLVDGKLVSDSIKSI